MRNFIFFRFVLYWNFYIMMWIWSYRKSTRAVHVKNKLQNQTHFLKKYIYNKNTTISGPRTKFKKKIAPNCRSRSTSSVRGERNVKVDCGRGSLPTGKKRKHWQKAGLLFEFLTKFEYSVGKFDRNNGASARACRCNWTLVILTTKKRVC